MNADDLGREGELDEDIRLPWSMARAKITPKGEPNMPSFTPSTGTATHSDWGSDDLNVDDH